MSHPQPQSTQALLRALRPFQPWLEAVSAEVPAELVSRGTSMSAMPYAWPLVSREQCEALRMAILAASTGSLVLSEGKVTLAPESLGASLTGASVRVMAALQEHNLVGTPAAAAILSALEGT